MFTFRQSDRAIVLRTMEGRPQAFETLIFRYQKKAHAIARAFGLESAAVDDVVQEAFLQAFRDLPALRDPSSFGSWFLEIVRHASLKEIRRAGRGGKLDAGQAASLRASASRSEPSAAEEIEQKDLREYLWRKVAELPRGTREAIFLYHHEGRSVRAVARALGISVSGAKKRLRTGREELREKLWRALGDALRETMPSRGEWRTSGRRLSLLVLGSIPGWWAARAGAMELARGRDPIGTLFREAAAVSRIERPAVLAVLKKSAVLAFALLLLFMGRAAWKEREKPVELAALPNADSGNLLDADPKPEQGTPAVGAELPRAEAAPPAEDPGADAPPGSDDRGSVVVRVIWGEDGTPAAGVGGQVIPWGSPDLYIDERTFTTGPDGTARVDGIFRGGGTVLLDRGGRVDVTVVAREEREAVIEVPPGFNVEGEVVDQRGYPVAGARIWISYTGHTNWGTEVATSRADGSFFVRSISSSMHMAAKAVNHAASDLYTLKGEPGTTVPVRLVLNGDGGEMVVTVLDERGEPVPRAKVMVGAEYAGYTLLDDGSTGLSTPPCLGFTDEDGVFHASSLLPGKTRVAIRAPAFIPLEEEIVVTPGSPAIVDLVLRRGATLSGRVLDPDGLPITGAQVVVGDFRDFLSIKVFSGDRGSYRLTGLPPGDVEVYSQRPGRGKASTRITVEEPGQSLSWDPVLTQDLEIRGRVVDENGTPLEGFLLLIEEETRGTGRRKATQQRLTTDSSGGFSQGELSDLSYRITVHEAEGSLPCGSLEGVRPGAGEAEIRVERQALSSAYLQGRVLDAQGRIYPGAKVICFSNLGGYRVAFAAKDGTYRVGPVPGGRYRIEVQAPGHASVACGEHDVEPREEKDLGDHFLGPAFR